MTFAILRRAHRFVRDPRGVAAIEFAMLLPIMLVLYLGTVEVCQGVSIERKVTLTARTVADLVTQSASVNNAAITNILDSSAKILSPYPTADLKVTVSAVTIDSTGKATVDWSRTVNGTPRSGDVSGSIPEVFKGMPAGLKLEKVQLIWAEGTYNYKPTIGYVITGPVTLSEQIFMSPRLSDKVTCTDCAP